MKTSASRLVIIFASLAASNTAGAGCNLDAVAVIPLVPFTGHYILAADINGKPANLIADTGASSTNIEISSAERLDLSMHLRSRDNQGIGGSEHAYGAFASSFRLSQLTLYSRFLGGTDVPGDPQIDGLLGMDMLTSYDIDLDLLGQHIILFEPSGDCNTPTVTMMPPLYSASLTYIRSDALAELDVFVEGKRIRALLDSGSPTSFIFRRAATLLRLDLTQFDGPNHHDSRGIGPKRVKSFPYVLASIGIGNLSLSNMAVEVLDQPGFTVNRIHIGSLLPDDDDGQPGGEQIILGADFMQKVHAWISHSSHRLIMQYPPQPSALPK